MDTLNHWYYITEIVEIIISTNLTVSDESDMFLVVESSHLSFCVFVYCVIKSNMYIFVFVYILKSRYIYDGRTISFKNNYYLQIKKSMSYVATYLTKTV